MPTSLPRVKSGDIITADLWNSHASEIERKANQGEPGPKGDQGDPGPQGPQGPPGSDGEGLNLDIGEKGKDLIAAKDSKTARDVINAAAQSDMELALRSLAEGRDPVKWQRHGNFAYLELSEMMDIAEGSAAKAVDLLRKDWIGYIAIDVGLVDHEGKLEVPSELDENISKWLGETRGGWVSTVATINALDILQTPAPGVIDQIANEALRMVWDYGFDGVQLDIEPFDHGPIGAKIDLVDKVHIPIAKAVREKLRDTGAHLSIALPAIQSGRITPKQVKEIAQLVDMVNPMTYDLLGPESWGAGTVQTSEQYYQLFRDEMLAYTAALEGTDCVLTPTVPAYEDRYFDSGADESYPEPGSGKIYYHLDEVENAETAIKAIRDAESAGAKVDGAAVFWYPSFHYPPFREHRRVWIESWTGGEHILYGSEFERRIRDMSDVGGRVLLVQSHEEGKALPAGTIYAIPADKALPLVQSHEEGKA